MVLTDEEFEAWIEGRPAAIQSLALQCPGTTCYQMTDNKGHYAIIGYGHNGTLKIVHGRDSYWPGQGVFGVKPEQMVRCGCGLWQPPTKEQMAERKSEAQAAMRAREERS